MSKYIDADASRDEFMEAVYDILTEDSTNNRANEIIDVFDALPAADVEPARRGEWKVEIGYDPRKIVQCSNCRLMNYEPTEYCPHCGAKMRFIGGGEE